MWRVLSRRARDSPRSSQSASSDDVERCKSPTHSENFLMKCSVTGGTPSWSWEVGRPTQAGNSRSKVIGQVQIPCHSNAVVQTSYTG